jgi:peroxiredoxin Q/BCP
MLKVGDNAPAFKAIDDAGQAQSLSMYQGKKVVLYFYPKDDTPGCTKEACDFRDLLTKLTKAGGVVLGVSKDSQTRHQGFKKRQQLNFPLLVDEEGKLCMAYGVFKEKSMFGKTFLGIERCTFLIDGKGRIAKIWRKVKVPGHGDMVLQAMQEIG